MRYGIFIWNKTKNCWQHQDNADHHDCGSRSVICELPERAVNRYLRCANCIANYWIDGDIQACIYQGDQPVHIRQIKKKLRHTELVAQLTSAFQEGLKGYPENKPEWSC